jgi:lipoprotein signal peptidase
MAVYLILAAVLAALDQWVKFWVVSHLALGESAPLLPGFVELYRVHNYGAAWSSFSGMRWVLIGVTSAIMLAVAALLARGTVRHPLGRTACALVLAGGVGNIIDRVRLGYVVDMFHFQFWPSYPVFNAADICVCVGAVLGVIYYLWFYEKYDKVRK